VVVSVGGDVVVSVGVLLGGFEPIK